MRRINILLVAAAVAIGLAAAGGALASTKNAIQPAHVYFGTVVSGDHPNTLVTLHNGTGRAHKLRVIGFAGANRYKFTNPTRPSTCKEGMILAAGATCTIDIRVHTEKVGWWRTALSVRYRPLKDARYWTAEVSAHVVAS